MCQTDLVCHGKSLTSTSPSPHCSLPLVYIVHQQLWLSSQGDIGLLIFLKSEPEILYKVKVTQQLLLQVRSSKYSAVYSLVNSGRHDEFPSFGVSSPSITCFHHNDKDSLPLR